MDVDEWKSEWVADQDKSNKCSSLISFEDGELVEYSNDGNEGLNASQDSIESTAAESDDKIEFILKPSLKGITQAKKRLKAFTATKLLKTVQAKEEKNLTSTKSEAPTTKKLKKELYPDERARAVIQEIEEIKKAQARQQFQQIAFVESIKKLRTLPVLTAKPKSRSRSVSSDDERLEAHFKRREIKVRNIRRGKTRSVSPETHNKKKHEKLTYPKNWSEYIQQNLDIKKDQELKSKLFPSYKRPNSFEIYKKIYNHQKASIKIEPFVYSTNGGGSKEVPPFFVRFTKTYPPVQYSINSANNDESFITRKQLFSIISKDAREIIEKLINSNQRSPAVKVLKERQWFNKSWKKIGSGESKFVENSVGLSFLQTYSDDDNDANDEEEIIICSRVTSSEKPSEQINFKGMEDIVHLEPSGSMVDVEEKQDELVQMEDNGEIITEDIAEQVPNEILPEIAEQIPCETSQEIPEEISQESVEGTPEVLPEEMNDVPLQDENEIGQTPDIRSSDGFRTPELRPNVESATEDRELDETRRAIEQLEDELKRKQEILQDDVRHVIELDLKNVKKKKIKNADVNVKSKKKKKKVKVKKHVSSEDDASSTDEKKKSKKKSRGKKLKKKSESEKPKKRTKKKKKRNSSISDSSVDEEEEDEPPKKKASKKKKHKETNKKLKKKRLKKDKQKTDWEETDEETVDEYTDEEKTDNRKLRKKLGEEHISKKKGDKQTSKRIFEIVSSKDESENREFGIELKINKKYLMRKGENNEVGEDHHLEPEKLISIEKSAKLCEEQFPLVKDILTSNKDAAEKSPYPLWESDEEVSPTKSQQKLNTSWESDEEVFVRRYYEPEPESEQCISKSYNDSCGKLEIPLNIKPYKRREIFEPDLRIQMEKKRKGDINFVDQITSDEEKKTKKREDILMCETAFDEETSGQRKPTENKQDGNFEVHIDLGKQNKEIEMAEFKIDFGRQVAIEEKRQREIDNLKMSELESKISHEIENNQVHAEKDVTAKDVENLQSKIITPKRGRWDKRESVVKASTPKSETDSVSTQSVHSEKNTSNSIIDLTTNNASSLENEYEEFLKAVTSNVAEDAEKSMPISISSMSDISDTDSVPVSFKKNDFIPIDTPVQIPVVLPKDIPFIPMPAEVKEIKPVPVPSPKIEVKKPLVAIDLDLITAIQKPGVTANITIPPVASVDLAVQGIPSSTMIQTPVSAMDDTSVSNSVDMNVDLNSIDLPPPWESTPSVEDEEQKPEGVEETLDEKITEEAASTKPPEKQFSFSGMVLTTKKLLLDKPKINFGDSDDDEPKTSLTKLEDIKKENAKISVPKEENVADQKVTTDEKIVSDEKKASEEKKEVEQPLKETVKEETKVERKKSRSRSPHLSSATGRSKEGDKKRAESPHKRRRSPSPRGRRRSSPLRRKESPRKGSSPRRRSPGRRRTPEKKKHPLRRSPSPRRSSGASSRKKSRRSTTPRKRGVSPKKRSPSPRKRSASPRKRPSSPKRKRSPSPRRRGSPRKGGSPKSSSKRLRSKSPERIQTITERRPRSPPPPRATSPHEGLMRSIADSTISDDLLPQPNLPYEEYANSPTFFDRRATDSPRRIPLEERISQVLGETKEEPKAITSTYGNYARYNQGEYSNQMDYPTTNYKPSSFVQVGNMLQIVPTELPTERPTANVEVVCQDKPSIIQVGNMLQIVPTSIPPQMPPLPPSPAPLAKEQLPGISETIVSTPIILKQSAEESMQQMVAERRAEREKRKLEREKKREEKEKKRREKEKKRQIRLKMKTENMIKRALQLEVEGGEEDTGTEPLVRWPPISVVCSSSKDIGKSILTKSVGKREGKSSSQKAVSFADGIRPGEGTSPSAGEELMSPPPKKLPKEKRYTKTNMVEKIKKKKVKGENGRQPGTSAAIMSQGLNTSRYSGIRIGVIGDNTGRNVKIIKKPLLPALSDGPDSDEDDHLPPPSPPPGSPPPHIFPPRVKVPAPNNLIPYAAATQLQMYGAQLGLMMAPPPPPPPPPPLPSTPPNRQSPVGHAGRTLGTHSHSHRTQLYHF